MSPVSPGLALPEYTCLTVSEVGRGSPTLPKPPDISPGSRTTDIPKSLRVRYGSGTINNPKTFLMVELDLEPPGPHTLLTEVS